MSSFSTRAAPWDQGRGPRRRVVPGGHFGEAAREGWRRRPCPWTQGMIYGRWTRRGCRGPRSPAGSTSAAAPSPSTPTRRTCRPRRRSRSRGPTPRSTGTRDGSTRSWRPTSAHRASSVTPPREYTTGSSRRGATGAPARPSSATCAIGGSPAARAPGAATSSSSARPAPRGSTTATSRRRWPARGCA